MLDATMGRQQTKLRMPNIALCSHWSLSKYQQQMCMVTCDQFPTPTCYVTVMSACSYTSFDHRTAQFCIRPNCGDEHFGLGCNLENRVQVLRVSSQDRSVFGCRIVLGKILPLVLKLLLVSARHRPCDFALQTSQELDFASR